MFGRKTLPPCRNLALFLAVASAGHLHAATFTWNAAAGNNLWTGTIGTITNWSPNSLPPSTADVAFTLITSQPSVNLQTTRTINSLTFGSLQNYTLTNGALSITSGNITVNASTFATNHTIAVPVTLGAAGTITVTDPAQLTLSGSISDGSSNLGLTKAGNGTLLLTSANNSLYSLAGSGGLVDLNGASLTIRNTDGGIYGTTFASSLTLRNGATLQLSFSNLQINGGAANTITIDGANSQISGANLFTLGNSGTPGSLHVANGGSIANTSALTVGGLDTGNLASTATFDSGATVSVGTFSVGAVANAVGIATITDAGTTFQTTSFNLGGFNSSQNGGNGTVTVASNASLSASGLTTFFTSASSLIVDHAAFSTAQLSSQPGVTGTIQLNGSTLTLNQTNLALTPNFAGTIADGSSAAGALSKTGGATQILSGHNTFTGGTTITGGTLLLGIEDALSQIGQVKLVGGTLDLGGHNQHIGLFNLTGGTLAGSAGSTLFASNATLSVGTIAAPLVVAQTLTKSTTGTVNVTAPLSAGTVTVVGGLLDAQNSVTLSGSLVVANGAQFKFRGTFTGGFHTDPGGTITLTGPSAITGNASVNGTLDINSRTAFFAAGDNPSIANTTIAGGTIVAADPYIIANSLSGFGTLSAAVSSPSPGTKNIIASGGTLSLGTFASTDSLASYNGSLTVGANQLNLLSSGFTSLGSSVSISGGSLASINGARVNTGKTLSGFGTIVGPLQNLGTVTGGAGNTTLRFTGAVSSNGSLAGNIEFDNAYAPGLGNIPSTGNVTFGPAGQLDITLARASKGTGYTDLTIAGKLSLDGSISVQTTGGYIPQPGTSYTIATFGSSSGAAPVDNKTGFPGLHFSESLSSTSLTLTATALPGDANLDNTVDLSDLSTILNNFGAATPNWTDGNFDNASTIDLTDLSDVLNNFGQTNPSAFSLQPSAFSNAPEPASSISLALASLLIVRRRSQR